MRFKGKIGYEVMSEPNDDGIYVPTITEQTYQGDILRKSSKWNQGEGINDDLVISNEISIVANAFALSHFTSMKYVIWRGMKLKITHIEVEPPRLTLTLGGEYNG